MKRLLIGAVAGTIATVPMTVVMERLHEGLPSVPARPLPPREVVEGAASQAGVRHRMTESHVQRTTAAAHFAFGAATGAVLGLIAPRSLPAAVACGAWFGLGVWTVSYLGWLPAAGFRHHAKDDPPARSALMIAAHVVWGAAAGVIMRAAELNPEAHLSRQS